MWCACPTRSPHSPSASSCPKPIPLLNLRPSPVEWAPYPTARTVPRMCERFFCTPAQVPPAFLHQVSTFLRTKFPPPLAHPPPPSRKPAHSRAEPPPSRTKFPPPLAHSPSTSRKHAHSRAELPPFRSVPPPSSTKPPPPLAHPPPTRRKLAHSRSVPPSVGTPPPGTKAKPLIGTTRPPAASTPSPHPTQKRPNLTPSRRKNVTLSTHSF